MGEGLAYRGQSASFILLIHKLVSSRNTPMGIPRIMFEKISGHPVASPIGP